MKYLPIATPQFDSTGTHADVGVTWYVGAHNGVHKLLTRENHSDFQTKYPAIAVSELTEAAIRGWQRGMADTEPDEEKGDEYASHEGYGYAPSDEVKHVYERQYQRAVKYAKEQMEYEARDIE